MKWRAEEEIIHNIADRVEIFASVQTIAHTHK